MIIDRRIHARGAVLLNGILVLRLYNTMNIELNIIDTEYKNNVNLLYNRLF